MDSGASDRVDDTSEGLADEAVPSAPYPLIDAWVGAAVTRSRVERDVPEPFAMALASVDATGAPNVRIVLLRFLSPAGPGFVTSLDSIKGIELAAEPRAAITIAWPAMFRAIRFRGRTETMARDRIEDYFTSRPWGSRVSAWGSQQSAPVADRATLEHAYAAAAARWPDTGSPDDVPVPPRWGGYVLVPDEVEFWAGRPDRLHDRITFSRTGDGDLADASSWSRQRRQP